MTETNDIGLAPIEQEPPVSAAWSAAVAAVVALLGVATIWGSLGLGYWTELGPGPGFFPLWLGVILAVLGSVWFLRSLREHRTHVARGEDDSLAAGEPDFSWPHVGAIVGSLIVLAAVLEPFGWQLAMLLFLVFHLKVLGRQGWLLTAVLSLVGSFGVFLVFTRVLTVSLPAASIPFLADLGL
jgi:putative tricarboxylic transport membrane protein